MPGPSSYLATLHDFHLKFGGLDENDSKLGKEFMAIQKSKLNQSHKSPTSVKNNLPKEKPRVTEVIY